MIRSYALILFSIGVSLTVLSSSTRAAVEFSLGSNYNDFYYGEELTLPAKSTESAGYPAFVGRLRFWYGQESYVQIRHEAANGVKSFYDGASLTNGTPVTATNPLSFSDSSVNFVFGTGTPISVQVGAGQHTWNRFLSGGSGYREIYTWTYVPIGLLIRMNQLLGVQVFIDATYRPTANGKLKLITSETISGGQDSVLELGAKAGFRLAIPAEAQLNPSWNVSVSPWYEQSQIGQSAPVANETLAPGDSVLEPSSKTTRYGLEFLVGYRFGK